MNSEVEQCMRHADESVVFVKQKFDFQSEINVNYSQKHLNEPSYIKQEIDSHSEEYSEHKKENNTLQKEIIKKEVHWNDVEKIVVKTEYVDVKEEPVENSNMLYTEERNYLGLLYKDHEIKTDLVIGPTLVQTETVSGNTESLHSRIDCKDVHNEESEYLEINNEVVILSNAVRTCRKSSSRKACKKKS
ncbi:uncharacterized protein LOC128200093 [Galleria mellonella]|uniref:Uncharacterized protein LOC128200093 n=1 Tax=Galleria mellonella TaxID=7137 RepID=A0ABM3M9W3_GALME|nr:uncharacterized protein LOC128200093 [Galleria mellonella]